MNPEQLADIGWDTKLPASLDEAIGELEDAIQAHRLDDLGADFLQMYVNFKKQEAAQSKEKSEEERLAALLEVF